jgi:dipeptidase
MTSRPHGTAAAIAMGAKKMGREPRCMFVTRAGIGLAGAWLAGAWLALAAPALACTSMLVTKGASADGSVIITYTCDGEFHPQLGYTPAAEHAPGDSVEIADWTGLVRGKIPQVPHTYAVVGHMNEHQLAIGESTFGGREELENPDGLLDYWDLIQLALERCRTAREAVHEMTRLVAQHGYRGTGESISIGDTNEAWLLEIIGPGPGGRGAPWVAVRIPDGFVSCHANKARIGEFPRNDPDNCIYAENVISFAIEKGYYEPRSGEPFSFCDAYHPGTPSARRWADARVWSILGRAAPSLGLTADYHRSVPGAEPYPLWVRPDKKLHVADVFSLMRDHFEGTPYDVTREIDAGPFGSPYRARPLGWSVDSVDYAWERPISTQQTGYSFVSQSRGWLPAPIGGVFWYGVDDTYTTCYVPLYCGISSVPVAFQAGSLQAFSWDSAWWVFNFVANYANLRYCDMVRDIRAVQAELEGSALAQQPAVDRTAVDLYKSDPVAAAQYLTDYSCTRGETTVARWRRLGEALMVKYNDFYVKDAAGHPQDVGYPEAWRRSVLRERGAALRLPAEVGETPKLAD